MTPSLRYVNHLGEAYDFDKDRVWPLCEGLYDFSFSFEAANGRLAGHAADEAEIPLSVSMDADDPARELNMLRRVLMADVEADEAGRLYDGAWYVRCVLKSSQKRLWYRDGRARTCDLVLWAPDPEWTRERVFSWAASPRPEEGLGYPHGYPHGYGSAAPVRAVSCASSLPCDLRIEVRGPADGPTVHVGGNAYTVAAGVPEGAVLAIDTRAATVEIETADGLRVNAFPATPDEPPGSGAYVFERVPPGTSAVSWDGSFALSVTVYERGREREWS